MIKDQTAYFVPCEYNTYQLLKKPLFLNTPYGINSYTAARWDKLKSWKILSDDIVSKINASEKEDEAITLDIGPQV